MVCVGDIEWLALVVTNFVTCFVWWEKADGSRARCAPNLPCSCRSLASQSEHSAGFRVVRRVCGLRHRQMVSVAGKFEREGYPEVVASFGWDQWRLAPLRVDLEAGERSLLASSPGCVDPGAGGVYSPSA